MVVLQRLVVEERIPAVGECVCAHSTASLTAFTATADVGGYLVVEAEYVFLEHVALVEGLVAQVTAVLAHTRSVVLVMLEVNIKLLLFHEQFAASANL